jgi:hypothetical protein
MVIVYSATKGLAAMTLEIAHSRGWLDYEELPGRSPTPTVSSPPAAGSWGYARRRSNCWPPRRFLRRAWLCGSGGGRRLRVRDEQDGDAVDGRPAGCGAQRRTLLRYSGFVRCVAG